MPVSFQREEMMRVVREDYSDGHWTIANPSNADYPPRLDIDLILSYEDEVVGLLMTAFERADTKTAPFSQIAQETNDVISAWFEGRASNDSGSKKMFLPSWSGVEAPFRKEEADAKRDFKEKAARRVFQAIVYENKKLVPEGLMLAGGGHGPERDNGHGVLPRVFLSYQYIDRLYTIGLFYAFLREGLDLYVDWMRSGKIEDAESLKSMLLREVLCSDHFASLPSVKAALGFNDDKNATTSWCAWEVGARRKRSESLNDSKVLICMTGTGNYDGIFKTFDEAHSMDDVLKSFGVAGIVSRAS